MTTRNVLKLILLFCFVLSLPANPAYSKGSVFLAGEYLEYDVSFMGISLGTIKMESIAEESLEGKTVYHVKSYMDSHSGIPFIDLHAIFESWVDPSLTHSHKFISTTKYDDKKWDYRKIIFDYSNNELRHTVWFNKILSRRDTIKTARKWNDGSSLFYFARRFTHYGKTVKVPTIISNDTVKTILNFRNITESVEIDAVDYPVRTLYFDGVAEWEGVYGLKGSFEGWFSDDEARIPIVSKMNVYVGSVVIELVKWKRQGWKPQRTDDR